jgi:hypothetical protein
LNWRSPEDRAFVAIAIVVLLVLLVLTAVLAAGVL